MSSYAQVTIITVNRQSAWDAQTHSWHVKVFRGSYVREFELSHSNLVSRVTKIAHAHNLHVEMLHFAPFYNSCVKERKLFERLICSKDFKKSPPFRTYAIKFCIIQFYDWYPNIIIHFQQNYQTVEILMSTPLMLFHSKKQFLIIWQLAKRNKSYASLVSHWVYVLNSNSCPHSVCCRSIAFLVVV